MRRIVGWTGFSVLFLCAAAALSGCAGLLVGAGAKATTATLEERGLKAAASDAAIQTNITGLWIDYNADIPIHVDAAISEGRVLLTGTVPTQQMRLDAVRIAWKSPGVRSVLNEIEVSNSDDVSSYSRDAWITTQLVSRLTFDEKVQSINYSVETVNSVVYLMGIAQDQAELDHVRDQARHVPYVRRVVSHVRLKDDPRRGKSGS